MKLLAFDSADAHEIAVLCADEDETRALGERLGALAPGGLLLTLQGDLGSGKTVFTQGFAWGLGVDRDVYVNSPSYTYVREHDGRVRLYHVDLYRVSDPEELELIGLRDFLDDQAVCAVEWPEQVPGWLPRQGIELTIQDAPGGRSFTLRPLDGESERLLDQLRTALAAPTSAS